MQTILSKLQPHTQAEVKRIEAKGDLRKRLLDMGIVPGCRLQVIKLAPLGDPIEVKVRGYHLSLRKEEARCIFVEVIS